MQGKPVSEQEIGKQLLLETAAYAESSVCRRRLLLHYFGEEFMEENCGNCDNCLNPKKQIEAKELLCVVLNAIINTKEKFKEELIVDFLLGKETAEIKDYKLSELDDFDSVEKEESNNLHAIIRQAMIAGFISKDIENYGLLKVTNEGKKYLKKPTSFLITENNEFSDEDDEMPLMRGGGSNALDSTLFSILKDLRKKKSKELKLPPFVIFQDPSLEAMATTYPITIEELKNVPGVGEGKAKRYGEDFISIIKKYVEENNIERPEDMRVRSIANRSKLKIAIIEAIDRRVALDDLAEREGIDLSELLNEIESIVYSGTKLNIDYFLDQIMDEDVKQEIFNYFKEDAETDSIESALKELGEDDYTEEEIRLVRIKFLSEMGN